MGVTALLIQDVGKMGVLTVGDGTTSYGYSISPFDTFGSLSGEISVVGVGGRTIQLLTSSSSGTSLYLAVTSNQNIFKTMYLLNAAGSGMVALNAADASFANNSPSGTSRWTWAGTTDVWTSSDIGELKRIGFSF